MLLKLVLCVRHSTLSSEPFIIGFLSNSTQTHRKQERAHAIATAENLDENIDVVDGRNFTQLGGF
jgi:hypothetical protein